MTSHSRRTLVLLTSLASCAWGTLAFAAGKPVIRVAIAPRTSVLVGQPVTATVQILVPNYFLSAPEWPVVDVEGAVVTMPDEVMPHLTETIGGDSYAGVQKKYVITPQQDGDFALPPVEIHFKYAAVPGQAPADGAVTLPAATFTARLPAGARTDQGVLPVVRLTVRQTLDRSLVNLEAGDALTRTITVVAAHTQPMMILPPSITAPDGVRIYRRDPALTTDLGTHGELDAGRRVDRVTYVFEKPGDYSIPAIEFPWFDASRGTREAATAPAIVVHVAPNTAAAPAIAPEPPPAAPPPPPPSPWLIWKRRLPWIAGGLAALFAMVWLLRRLWPRYRVWSSARRLAREESEGAYFQRFLAACATDDPAKAYAALARWAGCARHGSIASWSATLGSDPLQKEIAALERVLFAGRAAHKTGWNGAALAQKAQAARTAWRTTETTRTRTAHLPALNP